MNCVSLLCGDGSTGRALASESEGLSLVVVRIPLGAKIRLVEIDGQMIDRDFRDHFQDHKDMYSDFE